MQDPTVRLLSGAETPGGVMERRLRRLGFDVEASDKNGDTPGAVTLADLRGGREIPDDALASDALLVMADDLADAAPALLAGRAVIMVAPTDDDGLRAALRVCSALGGGPA